MEADQATEKSHTTVDGQEHTSSKDPSAEDFQELFTSETILEPSIPETPLVPLTSESHLGPSSPQIPLEIHPSTAFLESTIAETPLEALTSEYNMMPPSSLTPLETHTSETILESTIAETPLEALTSEFQTVPKFSSQIALETHPSAAILEPSVSETPLEALTPEFHIVPSSSSQIALESHPSAAILEPLISETPLEALPSESQVMPSSPSQMLLEIHPSASPLEPFKHPSEHSISEFPLETHIPKIPEENTIIHTSAQGLSSISSYGALKEDLVSPSSSSEVSWTRRDFQIFEYEPIQQHTPSGSSAQNQPDTSAKQREEEKEDEKRVDVTDSTAQPEQQLGKRKGKKGVSSYPVQSVAPAKQGELVEVAKAMPREKFGAQVQYRFQWEKNTALCAIQTGCQYQDKGSKAKSHNWTGFRSWKTMGLYIGWRCPHYLWDCFRIGDESKCFCGHLLKEHKIISDISVPCNISQCRCLMFCFIPSRPEEVGEFWLKRRATFDPKAWRAQCRCKHSHEDHAATGSKAVAATVLSLISSVRPATDAGRNMRLSLRLKTPDDEEGGLMVRSQQETWIRSWVCRQKGRQEGTLLPLYLICPIPALVSAPRSRLYTHCRENHPLRSHLNHSDFEALQKQGFSGHPTPYHQGSPAHTASDMALH
ncbi:Protein FAM221B [Galemys pyrenaicus]|uniref:Protein FAM221B n=1 Tax=Galemys pyrenaicus TaxID=202257 RepID=A0A8J5ZRC4_GALPY|nr:Protein FAM221B [Galemys pyrenaicus]